MLQTKADRLRPILTTSITTIVGLIPVDLGNQVKQLKNNYLHHSTE